MPGDVPGSLAVTLIACWAARPKLIHKLDLIGCPPKDRPVPPACFGKAGRLSRAEHQPRSSAPPGPSDAKLCKSQLNPHIFICCG